ncbi:hypothetical protein ACFX19_041040 [Malus domestica]
MHRTHNGYKGPPPVVFLSVNSAMLHQCSSTFHPTRFSLFLSSWKIPLLSHSYSCIFPQTKHISPVFFMKK